MTDKTGNIGLELEKIISSCLQLQIDPIRVLANALNQKRRIDGLICEALDEEISVACETEK
jgi:hypothetical protein